MSLTDYNHLGNMLGLSEISLGMNEYAIHIKERVFRETGNFSSELALKGAHGTMQFAGFYTEPFSQDGHNGCDYVIVVPDGETERMEPYYSELVVDIEGSAPVNLRDELDRKAEEDALYRGDKNRGMKGYGSDTFIVYTVRNLVRDKLVAEVKRMLATLIFPLLYVGLVFLCVALTVLSVQQLSDSAKYKFRYGVLRKIGMNRREIAGVVRKQLVGFYLCPVILAVAASGMIAVYAGSKFNFFVGTGTSVIGYLGTSFLLLFGIYAIYFIATYVMFLRNIECDG